MLYSRVLKVSCKYDVHEAEIINRLCVIEGESYADDFEDLRWNKRTQHLLHSLQVSPITEDLQKCYSFSSEIY